MQAMLPKNFSVTLAYKMCVCVSVVLCRRFLYVCGVRTFTKHYKNGEGFYHVQQTDKHVLIANINRELFLF